MKYGIILASSSISRRNILHAAGINFKAFNHLIDEDKEKRIILRTNTRLNELPEALAIKKAVSISNKYKESIVIGSDQVLVHKEKVLSKPKSINDLVNQLYCLQGNKHEIFSSCCIVKHGDVIWSHTERAILRMRSLNMRQIEIYVKENWEQVRFSVGGYHIESRGIKLFKKIEGDYFTIQGIPLIQLINFLISIKAVE
tara:strand:- start:411 stop:1007 length:597 start_codon:yes stop_codon:yes gene_type:complete